ncbi:MAG: hypothetical protein IJD28_00855 [Deferribacterales bacterium]|nr:hypothetical protein [Deferribacterales bacterium]
MADKLQWLDKHLILLNYETVKETAEKEQYKIRPDLESLANRSITSESYLQNLVAEEKWKDACEYLAYSMHRRAAVWWGYCCVLSLHEELDKFPESQRDISDIGKPKPHEIPDWAKDIPEIEITGLDRAKEQVKEAYAAIDKMNALIDPKIQKMFDETLNEMYSQIKAQFGVSPIELLQMAIDAYDPDAKLVDEANSPVVTAEKELKEKIEKMRTETVDLIKSVLPPQVPQHVKKMRASAMDAVYRWIAVPDEINSQKALDIGNECPDTPAGLLSLTAFWSFGNLTPTGKQFIATPAGLAANGLNSVLLNAALHKGGERKPQERFRHYFEIGLDVAYGKNNWGESIENREAPHRDTPVGRKEENVAKNDNLTTPPRHVRFRDKPVQ